MDVMVCCPHNSGLLYSFTCYAAEYQVRGVNHRSSQGQSFGERSPNHQRIHSLLWSIYLTWTLGGKICV